MSNVERDPHETRCGGVATLAEPDLRVLAAREVPLGGPRAMQVRRTLPHRGLSSVGAWCFLDDYGPHDVTGTAGMQVPPHPHSGLQTVSWLLDGEVRHQDSLGSEALARPGTLNLMTAGRGIGHAETSPAGATGRLRGLQLWVALPDASRAVAAHFEHHDDLPVGDLDGLRVTVLMGEVAGLRSPARTYSPVVGAQADLTAGGGRLPLREDFEHAVLPLDGPVRVAGTEVAAGALAYLGTGRREVALATDRPVRPDRPCRVLLVGGAPFEEELLMWWNFVARDHDEIVTARETWEAARLGADTVFGRVPAYDGAALPAPKLPAVRLRPRSR